MPGFSESNITLNFPDSNFFRLQDCAAYTNLSSHYFKEMDACWFDIKANQYWLIELKDFSLASLTTAETIEKKSWDIVKKALDSFCMFLSKKHGYPYAENLPSCIPNSFIDNNTRFNFITIIHCDQKQKQDIQLINEQFKKKFKPYASLFDIAHYSVLEHSTAIRIIPNNIVL